MSIYRRDEVFPEWEPMPWGLGEAEADQQEIGFHARALKPILWIPAPWKSFPKSGIFGHERDWFVSNDIAFYSTFDDEDLILIRNTWHSFPDPPEWGLASRPEGKAGTVWAMWGHFPELPRAWQVPVETA
jgi:hypothetical protein